jgi:cytochrome P450
VNVAIEIPDDIGRVLAGQAGDLSRAVLEAIPAGGLLHIAAHGHHEQENPLFSGVLLADGLLYGYDVAPNPALRPKFVVESGNDGRSRLAAQVVAQLGDQVATMILAGHETTAAALFWSLYLLALDPAAQEEVAAEVSGAAVNGAGDLDRLKFTRAVVDETMRLYPPAFLIIRAAAGPDTIAGMKVKRRDVVLVAPWLLHRHEKLWRDPNAFVPQRFMTGTPPDRFAYLPFGVGARVCIGAHFALVEATLALARIIGAFRIELLDQEPVIPVGVVTTQPDRSPMFRITPR